MKRKANWKEVAELIGIASIVASLIFVGFEMRQARDIAISDGDKAYASLVVATQGLINAHADVWLRGNSGAELDKTEAVIFENLVAAKMEGVFVGWNSLDRLGENDVAATLVNDFTGFLFRNPGARREWVEAEETFNKYRELLNPDGNQWNEYVEQIKDGLAKLDGMNIDR